MSYMSYMASSATMYVSKDANELVVRSGQHRGIYDAVSGNCQGCSFYTEKCMLFSNRKQCTPDSREDSMRISWVKNTDKTANWWKRKHDHAELMKQVAEDDSLAVWTWIRSEGEWVEEAFPDWHPNCIYAVGEKPVLPPTHVPKSYYDRD